MTRNGGDSLELAVGDLPPDAPVTLAIHSVVDLTSRGEMIPWDYWVDIELDNGDGTTSDVFSAAAFNAIDFPLVGDWSKETTTDSTGVLSVHLNILECSDRADAPSGVAEGCLVFLPATRVTATLLDTNPWEAAPACP